MRVIAYIRVSTDGQAADDRFGLLVQRQKITEYCSANDMEIVKWYTDEGESGAKERPGFDEICYGDIPDVEACVVAKSDRVARDINIYFYYKMLLTKKNIKLISVSEDFGIYGAFAPILEAFSMCVAQMERDNITMRTSAGRNAKARQGGWAGGGAPYGYKLLGKELVIVPAEKKAVRIIFEMRSEGMPIQGICDYLNDHRIHTRSGGEWAAGTLYGVLKNRKLYEGYYKYKGTGGMWVQGQHEPILAEGEFPEVISRGAPIGYRIVNKQMLVVADERDTVRFIFSRRAGGVTLSGIADELNQSGHLTKYGNEWSQSSVRALIENRKFYEGYRKERGEWVKGDHKPILEEGEYETEVDCRKNNRKSQKEPPTPPKLATATEISKAARDCKGMNEDAVRLVIKTSKPHFTESDIKMVLAMKN